MAESVAVLKSKRRTAKNKRKTFKNRMDAVGRVKNRVYSLDDYSGIINRQTNCCADNLSNALKGFDGSVVFSLCDKIRNSDENTVLSGQNGYNYAIQRINNEYYRCQDEITTLDYKIRNYERQIKEQGGVIMPWE